MTSKLKLKRKKFEEPYKEIPDNVKCDEKQCIEVMGDKVKVPDKSRIFQRAVENARKHNIKLKPGTENNGHGNCSYKSVGDTEHQ